MNRRQFLQTTAGAAALPLFSIGRARAASKPNLLFVFSDQWRAQAVGYAGDEDVKTPHLDALASQSINFTNVVASCPVCSPYRGSLLTGRYPDQHGVFLNDVHLRDDFRSIGNQLRDGGYETGWIGKWHLNGKGRLAFIPPEERQGFEFWRTMECTHNYNNSWYYADTPEKLKWDGYDAFAQTREAARFLKERQDERPFALFLSWGPPHNPYNQAPAEYRAMYDPQALTLRSNFKAEDEQNARREVADYYAHCTALDHCVGELVETLEQTGQAQNTILVVTSDHGDMLHSQGEQRKQRPWDESIRVPFLLRYPDRFSKAAQVHAPMGTPDLMPTILDLCGVSVPDEVQGVSRVTWLEGDAPEDHAALIACYTPFGEWTRAKGGREYRGIRTRQFTYVRDLEKPWLLYDNEADPHQLQNLCNAETQRETQANLESQLQRVLKEAEDEFLPAAEYRAKWGYVVDENETVQVKN